MVANYVLQLFDDTVLNSFHPYKTELEEGWKTWSQCSHVLATFPNELAF